MNYFQLSVCIVFLVFSVYTLRYAVGSYNKALDSKNWPFVIGQLVDVHLWGKRLVDGVMTDSEHLSVEYEYKVDQVSYTGTLVAFYTLMYPETIEYALSHPCDTELSIYYNPYDPASSVLITGPRIDKPYSGIIIASIAVVVITAIGISGLMGWLN